MVHCSTVVVFIRSWTSLEREYVTANSSIRNIVLMSWPLSVVKWTRPPRTQPWVLIYVLRLKLVTISILCNWEIGVGVDGEAISDLNIIDDFELKWISISILHSCIRYVWSWSGELLLWTNSLGIGAVCFLVVLGVTKFYWMICKNT